MLAYTGNIDVNALCVSVYVIFA